MKRKSNGMVAAHSRCGYAGGCQARRLTVAGVPFTVVVFVLAMLSMLASPAAAFAGMPPLPSGSGQHASAEGRLAASLDKDALPDGDYAVQVEMVKVNRKDYSMANDAIDHSARLTVQGGAYSVSLVFKGLTIRLAGKDHFGYLSKLRYYGAGFTWDKYGYPQGDLLPATVVDTQKTAGGQTVVDSFNDAGDPYPKTLRFPLVEKAAGEGGFVPLQVFVPIMESISKGTGTQDVLMRVDWATLKESTPPPPAALPALGKVQGAKA
ncbi:MAG: NEAT domain-containing protein, partial [Clostridiales Family XIII bacterium]|nr:NEAT domain-containing protein [Clostridiales Family XIII bacterium]